MDRLADQIIIDIISREMNLLTQNIWIRDQNRKIPNDLGLYVIVGMTDGRAISSINYMKEVPDPADNTKTIQVEVTEAQVSENIQVDILAKSDPRTGRNPAIERRWEIIAALNSFYSKQKQEQHSFKISKLPRSFVNTSAAEGGSQLNRYSLSFSCLVWYRKERTLSPYGGDYYDDFTTRVDDDKTIGTDEGLFEFRIAAEE